MELQEKAPDTTEEKTSSEEIKMPSEEGKMSSEEGKIPSDRALAQAVCPNCGGVQETDPAQEAAICIHCGKPFIVEKGIREYLKQNPPPLSEEAIRLRREADALHVDNAEREKQVLRIFRVIFAALIAAAGILWLIIRMTGAQL